MNRRDFLIAGGVLAAAAAVIGTPGAAFSADSGDIALPAPDTKGGMPLMAAMAARRADHNPGKGELDLQDLSNVLWAAWGISSDSGKRTVPTAMNKQEAELYAVLGTGTYRYDAKANALVKVLSGDRRGSFDGSACILLFAAPASDQFGGMHVGSMYQNAGLYCASAGLKECVKFQKRDALDEELPLKKGWKVLITLSVAK